MVRNHPTVLVVGVLVLLAVAGGLVTPVDAQGATSTPTATESPTDSERGNETALIAVDSVVTVLDATVHDDDSMTIVVESKSPTLVVVTEMGDCAGACSLERKQVTVSSGKTRIEFPYDKATVATTRGIVLLNPSPESNVFPSNGNQALALLAGILVTPIGVWGVLVYREKYGDKGVETVEQ